MQKRRWFRFGLGSLLFSIVPLGTLLFGIVPLASGVMATVQSIDWINQRHAMIGSGIGGGPCNYRLYVSKVDPKLLALSPISVHAPGFLWLFGEEGHPVLIWDREARGAPSRADVERLFPEASVMTIDQAETYFIKCLRESGQETILAPGN